MKYGGMFGVLSQYLCWISSIYLVIQSIKKCLNVSFYSLLNVEEVEFL